MIWFNWLHITKESHRNGVSGERADDGLSKHMAATASIISLPPRPWCRLITRKLGLGALPSANTSPSHHSCTIAVDSEKSANVLS